MREILRALIKSHENIFVLHWHRLLDVVKTWSAKHEHQTESIQISGAPYLSETTFWIYINKKTQ